MRVNQAQQAMQVEQAVPAVRVEQVGGSGGCLW